MKIGRVKKQGELPKLTDLLVKVMAELPYNEKWTRTSALKRLQEIFESGKNTCFFAEDNGSVVGILFCRTHIWDDGVHGFIEEMIVAPNYRKKGVATELIKNLERTAKAEKIVSIEGLVNQNAMAPKFWKKVGYKKDKYTQYTKKI